ncbi:unnamed protein product [Prorocentrum cordatum]|uniref:Ubiquitin-like domain-containing protein n=1 Tax=Prorocentrum cordatum TaxID=2364126 RepID=A0ABN9PA05_9DINO|nr:unnamed protein product [Polarella glacialis]
MRVSVLTCGGRELASLDAAPGWGLHDVLAALPEGAAAPGCHRSLLLGGAELREGTTLAELGASAGAALTLVVTPPLHVLCACADAQGRLWDLGSGRCVQSLRGHAAPVKSAVASPDGRQVLTRGTTAQQSSGVLPRGSARGR